MPKFAKALLREAGTDLVAWTCPVSFAEQRRYRDHLETIPLQKRQRLAPPSAVLETTDQRLDSLLDEPRSADRAARLARKNKAVRVLSKLLQFPPRSTSLPVIRHTSKPRPSAVPRRPTRAPEEPRPMPSQAPPVTSSIPQSMEPRPRGRPRGSRNTKTLELD